MPLQPSVWALLLLLLLICHTTTTTSALSLKAHKCPFLLLQNGDKKQFWSCESSRQATAGSGLMGETQEIRWRSCQEGQSRWDSINGQATSTCSLQLALLGGSSSIGLLKARAIHSRIRWYSGSLAVLVLPHPLYSIISAIKSINLATPSRSISSLFNKT